MESEYVEMFYAEAYQVHEELDRLLTQLEKEPSNKQHLWEIFRKTHTLKGNAMGLGLEGIGKVSHMMEEVFVFVRDYQIALQDDIFSDLFKANDVLGDLVEAIKTKEEVTYEGVIGLLSIKLEKLKRETIASGVQKVEPDRPKLTFDFDEELPAPSDEGDDVAFPVRSPPASFSSIKEFFKRLWASVGRRAIPAAEATEERSSEDESAPEEAPMVEHSMADPEAETAVLTIDYLTGTDEETGVSEDSQWVDSEPEEEVSQVNFSDQVQIPVRKLDSLLNLMGELIIEKDTIITQFGQLAGLQSGRNNQFARLHRITSDMQYAVMDIRMVQVGVLFNKFHRVVRDVADARNKKVNLVLEGTDIEIDRNILKAISDSLVHLIRNSIDHGIEETSRRLEAGKSAEGEVKLVARSEKDSVIIEVSDNGQGIDAQRIKSKAIEKGIITEEYAESLSEKELIYLIFESGFSNAEEVSEISGRGVGMDVVKRSAESIGGQVFIDTQTGIGTTITMTLPSSMAVKGALLFIQDEQEFAVPLYHTEAVISLKLRDIHKVKNGLMADYQGHTMMVIYLKDLFAMDGVGRVQASSLAQSFQVERDPQEAINVIVIRYNDKYIGFVVDKLLQQREIVEKTLDRPLDSVDIFSGATILGNGNVCLVLNVAAIVERLFKERFNLRASNGVKNELMSV